jgi:hypothetical protein
MKPVPGLSASNFRWCSSECEELAEKEFHKPFKNKGAFEELREHCSQQEFATRFPLLACRMAVASLPTFGDYWQQVNELCYAKTGDEIPPQWLQEYEMVRTALCNSMEGDVQVLFDVALTPEWYARLMGTLHLNCITVVVDDAESQQIRGTALYTLGSIFNHSW